MILGQLYTFQLFHHTVYFAYQSYVFNVAEWISLITLCFAPLIAHVIAGVPTPTYLSLSCPRWHDNLILYHPVSIIWRYLSITDRRLRAKSWDVADLAAANAIFWTSHGWEGTEDLGVRTRTILTRQPRKSKFRKLLSTSTMSTIVTSLQGVQAVYMLADDSTQASVTLYSMNNVFNFIALLGLLRLPAALWITDDYAYSCDEPDRPEMLRVVSGEDIQTFLLQARQSQVSSASDPRSKRYDPMNWQSILLRLGFVLFMGALAVYTIIFAVIRIILGTSITTSSNVTAPIMYLFLAVPGALILLLYAFWPGTKATTTVIPCAGSAWYKIYTLLWFLWALFAMIISALTTARNPCGLYSTIPLQLYPADYKCT